MHVYRQRFNAIRWKGIVYIGEGSSTPSGSTRRYLRRADVTLFDN